MRKKTERGELVAIDTLTFGGAGLGRVDGKVCFVPLTTVGDVVRVRIVTEKKSYLEGEVVEYVQPSPSRILPPCPLFGECGGCCWQHIPYEIQCAAKEKIFSETLARTARVEIEKILPIIPSPSSYGYRSRAQFKALYAGGVLTMGFYRRESHFVIDMPNGCAIVDEKVNRIFLEMRMLLSSFPEPEGISQIDVAVGEGDDATVLFHYIGGAAERIIGWLERELPGRLPVTGIFLQGSRKSSIRKVWGEERLDYSLPHGSSPEGNPLTLSFRCGGFSQVNYAQNTVLIEAALAWADLRGHERVLDLYCGNGNFSLPFAQRCRQVLGFEDFQQSIEDAVENSRRNGLDNTEFFSGDSTEGVLRLIRRKESFDLVVLDPPRTGALDTVRLIPQLKPEKILYVSCDPPTLARDLASLGKNGYEVVASRPVDMFPQTYHIESITLLRKV